MSKSDFSTIFHAEHVRFPACVMFESPNSPPLLMAKLFMSCWRKTDLLATQKASHRPKSEVALLKYGANPKQKSYMGLTPYEARNPDGGLQFFLGLLRGFASRFPKVLVN